MVESIEVIIRQPGFPDRVIPLRSGRTRLGRADDNEIVLSDVGVSRRHAQIVVEGGEVSVEDLDSGNGTYYFGHRIKSQALRDQDEVVIDPFVLQFRMVGHDDLPSGTDTIPSPETLAASGPRLEVVVGNGVAAHLYPIGPQGLTMGRAEDRDVVLPDAASSRHHCHILEERGEYVLHDNGSANGVFVNAVRVRECTLSDGDLVRVGNTELRFVNPLAAGFDDPGYTEPAPSEFSDPEPTGLEESIYEDESVSEAPAPRRREPQPGGAPSPFIMASIAVIMGLVLLGAGTIIAVALVLLVLSSGVSVDAIDPHPPTWRITGAGAPPADPNAVFARGQAATQKSDYKEALGHFYSVLTADPGNVGAKKFAAFTGEVLVVSAIQAEMNEAATARDERLARRDLLIRQYKRGSHRRKVNAKAELNRDFREDPVWAKVGPVPLSSQQQSIRTRLAQAEQKLKFDDHADVIDRCLKLLEDTREVEIRAQVFELLRTARKKQDAKVAKVWRESVMAEARGDEATAKAGYQSILEADPNNVSANLRFQRLK